MRAKAEFNGNEVPVTRLKHDRASIEVDKPPRAQVSMEGPPTWFSILGPGSEVVVRRSGERIFTGVVDRRVRRRSSTEGMKATMSLTHKGYVLLRNATCDGYDFEENGLAITTRDAVHLNPWKRKPFPNPSPSATLDADGNPDPVDGITRTENVESLLGSKLAVQMDYTDSRWWLASQHFAQGQTVQVYQGVGEDRPSLQRTKTAAGYAAGDTIESVPIMNGEPNIKPMGDVSTVTVLFLGSLNASQHPTARICRNAGEGTRTYTSVTLTHTANYLGSGLDAWEGTVDLSSDGATQKNQVGIELTIPGTGGDAGTTQVYYGKVLADTTTDTGLTAGTIDPYVAPSGLTADTWVDDDYETMKRLDAAERTRQGSPTATAAHPLWDLYIDADLALHFVEDRGTDTGLVFTPDTDGVEGWDEDEFDEQLAFQTVFIGGGQGPARIQVVDRTEHSAGGLYDSDRDPDDGALFGVLPGVFFFKDTSVTSRKEGRLRAFALHKYYRDPQVRLRFQYQAKNVGLFDVGDRIRIKDLELGIDETVRVTAMSPDEDGSEGEVLDLEVGERMDSPESIMRRAASQQGQSNVTHKASPATTGVGGPGELCDKDTYARFPIPVPRGADVERVELILRTLPWHVGAKAADATGVTAAAGGSNLIRPGFTDKSGTVDNTDYGSQDLNPGNVDTTDYGLQSLTSGNVTSTNYGTQILTSGTAAGQTVQGQTETFFHDFNLGNNPWPLNTPSAYQTYTVPASGFGSWVTVDSFNGPGFTTDFMLFYYEVFNGANASDRSHEVDVRVTTSGGTQVGNSLNDLGIVYDNRCKAPDEDASFSNFITLPMGSFLSSGSSYNLQVRLRDLSGGASPSYVVDVKSGGAVIFDRHEHVDSGGGQNGTLAGQSSGLSGNTGSKTLSPSLAGTSGSKSLTPGLDGLTGSKSLTPGLSLDAADLDALLQTTKVGYRSDDGGTGSILYTEGGIDYHESHEHAFSVTDIPLDYGLFQFGFFGEGVQWGVDPNVDGFGTPTTWSTDKHDIEFGDENAPDFIRIDVTGLMRTGANGIILDGEHTVYVLGQASGNNPEGLTKVSVTPLVTLKETST